MNHPPRRHRWLFTIALALMGAAFATVAYFASGLHPGFEGKHWLLDVEQVCFEIVLIGVAFAALGFSVAIYRGPTKKPKTQADVEAPMATAAMLVVNAFFGIIVARCSYALFVEGVEQPVAVGIVGGIFAILLLVFVPVLLNGVWLLLNGFTPRIHLPNRVLMAGESFEGAVEVPFAVEDAPPMTATLALVESYSPGVDWASQETDVWTQTVALGEWEFVKPGRCKARFGFRTPADKPCNYYDNAYTFFWRMQVKSAEGKRQYQTLCLIPIAFDDPVEEGLIAPAIS